MAELVLSVERREKVGKQYAKRLRREGRIPGVLYGPGEEPVPFHVAGREFEDLLHAGGRSAVVTLAVAGQEGEMPPTLIREIQQHPITGNILHVDMLHVSLTETIRVEVPVVSVGVPTGVVDDGGILEHLVNTLEMECLPAEIPEHIEVDVSHLAVGDSVHVSDLLEAEDRIVTEAGRAVFMVAPPTIVRDDELEAEEGEEGEEEAAEEEEAPTEPELIGRGSKEEDEE